MSVSALFTGQYYTVPTSASASTSISTSVSTPIATTVSPSLRVAGLLLQAESQDASADSDTVSLSLDAQNYLSTNNASTNFQLSASQQQQITQILNNYANAPLTQATFDSVQDDLKAAGLSPDQLAGQDITLSYSAAQNVSNALNGTGSTDTALSVSDEQVKTTNYVTQLYSQLQSIQAAASQTSSTGTDILS